MLKTPMDKYHATVFLGLCELIGAILCISLVRFVGKRPLIFLSLIVSAICFSSTAFYAHHYGITSRSDNSSTITNNNTNRIECQNASPQIIDLFSNVNNNSMIQYDGGSVVDYDKRETMKTNDNLLSWTPLVLLLVCALFTHIGIGMMRFQFEKNNLIIMLNL